MILCDTEASQLFRTRQSSGTAGSRLHPRHIVCMLLSCRLMSSGYQCIVCSIAFRGRFTGPFSAHGAQGASCMITWGSLSPGVLNVQKDMAFLDEDLPQDAEELTTRIKEVGKEASQLRRQQQPMVPGSPEFVELKTQIDQVADLRDRLINQKTNVLAGTKIVSRLTATGRARQLVSDDEHRTSACSL